MPGLDLDPRGLPAVERASALLRELLEESSLAKQTTTVEPAIVKADFINLSARLASALDAPDPKDDTKGTADTSKYRRNACLETAARDLFWHLIATTAIESPDFVQMWNFLDILSILSDDGHCDGPLLFWLIEELLESQTISGCRNIFDYLESRRERITAKFFDAKKLVILRTCNELLRRLSRAEDTTFCGRVFIFLFQSFPLGDRSSVNLRGEYHIENVTTYDTSTDDDESRMDVDASTAAKPEDGDKTLDANALYPLFWSLQDTFSQPQRLFEAAHFDKFKKSLDSTMRTFKTIPRGNPSRAPQAADQAKRGMKRKRDGDDGTDATLPEAFNPKYLTSKDLFELEISDLSFRRNILVQALIIVEFLLSLTPQFKEKLATVTANNRSVNYAAEISEEDIKWVNNIKTTISDYIKSSSLDGPYFYRMVETVLARDKNWVFWKIGSCPPIKRDPVSPAVFNQARADAVKMTTNKRLRPVPMGAVPMDFLKEENKEDGLKTLQSEERYKLPDLDSFKSKISDDDFDIDTATTAEAKAAAVARKASKTWRALRIAGRFKLAAFDKIDDYKDIRAAFEELNDDETGAEAEAPASEEAMPPNRDPIIISGPKSVGKTTLVQKLMEDHKGVFATAVRHTTREPAEGEVNGKTFHFVKGPEFSQLASNDRLIENGTRDGFEYGTSTKAIDTITEQGKIPIIELDTEAAQYAKDMGFSARFILIKPASDAVLRERLEKAGVGAEQAGKIVEQLPAELEDAKVAEVFDTVIVGDDAEWLRGYVFKKEGDEEMVDVVVE